MSIHMYHEAGHSDSEEFESWIKTNTAGYFINEKTDTTGVLHRSTCPHMKYDVPVDLVANRKICSMSSHELEAWAQHEEMMLEPCSDCDV